MCRASSGTGPWRGSGGRPTRSSRPAQQRWWSSRSGFRELGDGLAARRFGLELVSPAEQGLVDRGGADERVRGRRERHRVEQERTRLRAAEAAVEADQLLERATL